MYQRTHILKIAWIHWGSFKLSTQTIFIMISLKFNRFILLLLLFLGETITAQEDAFNRFSLEVTTGIHIPMSPSNEISNSDFIAFKQFQLAGRYMFSEKLGLKALYGFNQFTDPDQTQNGISFNRIGVEGVVNVGKLLNINYTIRERLALLAHGGAGLTFAKASSQNNTDHIGNILLGLTAEIKLSNRFSLLTDATYIANFRQHHYYNGAPLPNGNYQTGSLLNLSVGIMYSLGSKEIHADWY